MNGVKNSSLFILGLLGCAHEAPTEEPASAIALPTNYSFSSRFSDDSPLSYSGQTAHQVLLIELENHIAGMSARIDNGSWVPTAGEVAAAADFFFHFDSDSSGSMALTINTAPELFQNEFDSISVGKNLASKLAGNDKATDHRDWAHNFQGWLGAGSASPEALVEHWFAQLDGLAIARVAGEIPLDPAGNAITKMHVSPEGHDLQQLLSKFMGMAVFFSQASDDYLDDDIAGKGLLSSNTQSIKNGALQPFSALGHAWDEAFGYFGAARDFDDYSDDEIAAKGGRDGWRLGYHDSNRDGSIDLKSEYNFGHSRSAAKRDRGTAEGAQTDFTKQVFDAFIAGRALILAAGDELSAAELSELKGYRDRIVWGWESAIAATAVHYINELLVDMDAFDSDEYSFTNHAKHWSELKGFTLGLQFNPRSALSHEEFSTLHNLIGQAPALPGDAMAEGYRENLLTARALLGESYHFAQANLGDEDGMNGW
jgi:hypothetical protein